MKVIATEGRPIKHWYNVKEFKPINGGTYIVYVEITGFCYIACVDSFNDGTFHFTNENNLEYIENVSHFMDIPPLPIREEED